MDKTIGVLMLLAFGVLVVFVYGKAIGFRNLGKGLIQAVIAMSVVVFLLIWVLMGILLVQGRSFKEAASILINLL